MSLICEEGKTDRSAVTFIREPSTCKYTIEVTDPLACNSPSFEKRSPRDIYLRPPNLERTETSEPWTLETAKFSDGSVACLVHKVSGSLD